jgi:hypothetical protein
LLEGVKAVTELVQFVGYFLAIGAVGFRFGVVRRTRGISDEAKEILRADKAAMFGVVGVLLIGLALVGGPYINAITHDKTFAESLPKNLSAFEFKLAMLALALIGFTLVRVASSVGWTLAAIGILFAVLQPIYTGKLAGKVNAVHVLAASTWLGTLMVLTVVGIRGVIRSAIRRSATMELTFAALVLIVTSVLVTLPSPK